MVHTMVTIMYALNMSRYSNKTGPRHTEFLQHLLADRLKFSTHDGPTDIETMTPLMQLMFQCDADPAFANQLPRLGYSSAGVVLLRQCVHKHC